MNEIPRDYGDRVTEGIYTLIITVPMSVATIIIAVFMCIPTNLLIYQFACYDH